MVNEAGQAKVNNKATTYRVGKHKYDISKVAQGGIRADGLSDVQRRIFEAFDGKLRRPDGTLVGADDNIIDKEEIKAVMGYLAKQTGKNKQLGRKEFLRLLNDWGLSDITREDLDAFLGWMFNESENVESSDVVTQGEGDNAVRVVVTKNANGDVETRSADGTYIVELASEEGAPHTTEYHSANDALNRTIVTDGTKTTYTTFFAPNNAGEPQPREVLVADSSTNQITQNSYTSTGALEKTVMTTYANANKFTAAQDAVGVYTDALIEDTDIIAAATGTMSTGRSLTRTISYKLNDDKTAVTYTNAAGEVVLAQENEEIVSADKTTRINYGTNNVPMNRIDITGQGLDGKQGNIEILDSDYVATTDSYGNTTYQLQKKSKTYQQFNSTTGNYDDIATSTFQYISQTGQLFNPETDNIANCVEIETKDEASTNGRGGRKKTETYTFNGKVQQVVVTEGEAGKQIITTTVNTEDGKSTETVVDQKTRTTLITNFSAAISENGAAEASALYQNNRLVNSVTYKDGKTVIFRGFDFENGTLESDNAICRRFGISLAELREANGGRVPRGAGAEILIPGVIRANERKVMNRDTQQSARQKQNLWNQRDQEYRTKFGLKDYTHRGETFQITFNNATKTYKVIGTRESGTLLVEDVETHEIFAAKSDKSEVFSWKAARRVDYYEQHKEDRAIVAHPNLDGNRNLTGRSDTYVDAAEFVEGELANYSEDYLDDNGNVTDEGNYLSMVSVYGTKEGRNIVMSRTGDIGVLNGRLDDAPTTSGSRYVLNRDYLTASSVYLNAVAQNKQSQFPQTYKGDERYVTIQGADGEVKYFYFSNDGTQQNTAATEQRVARQIAKDMNSAAWDKESGQRGGNGMGTNDTLLNASVMGIHNHSVYTYVNQYLQNKDVLGNAGDAKEYAKGAEKWSGSAVIYIIDDEQSSKELRSHVAGLSNRGAMTVQETGQFMRDLAVHNVRGWTTQSSIKEAEGFYDLIDSENRYALRIAYETEVGRTITGDDNYVWDPSKESQVERLYQIDGWDDVERARFMSIGMSIDHTYDPEHNEGDRNKMAAAVRILLIDKNNRTDEENALCGFKILGGNEWFYDNNGRQLLADANRDNSYTAQVTGQDEAHIYMSGLCGNDMDKFRLFDAAVSNPNVFTQERLDVWTAQSSILSYKKGNKEELVNLFNSQDPSVYNAIEGIIKQESDIGYDSLDAIYNNVIDNINREINDLEKESALKKIASLKDEKLRITGNAILSGKVTFTEDQIQQYCLDLMLSISLHAAQTSFGDQGSIGDQCIEVVEGVDGKNVKVNRVNNNKVSKDVYHSYGGHGEHNNSYMEQQSILEAIIQKHPNIAKALRQYIENNPNNFIYYVYNSESDEYGVSTGKDTVATYSAQQRCLNVIDNSNYIVSESKYVDGEGNEITDPDVIAQLQKDYNTALAGLRKQVAILYRDYQLSLGDDGWMDKLSNNWSEHAGVGVDKGDVENAYRKARTILTQLEAAADGRLRDNTGKVLSASEFARTMQESLQNLGNTIDEHKSTKAMGKIIMCLAPVIVVSCVVTGGAASAGWGTAATATATGIAAGGTELALNTTNDMSSTIGLTADKWGRNIENASFTALTAAVPTWGAMKLGQATRLVGPGGKIINLSKAELKALQAGKTITKGGQTFNLSTPGYQFARTGGITSRFTRESATWVQKSSEAFDEVLMVAGEGTALNGIGAMYGHDFDWSQYALAGVFHAAGFAARNMGGSRGAGANVHNGSNPAASTPHSAEPMLVTNKTPNGQVENRCNQLMHELRSGNITPERARQINNEIRAIENKSGFNKGKKRALRHVYEAQTNTFSMGDGTFVDIATETNPARLEAIRNKVAKWNIAERDAVLARIDDRLAQIPNPNGSGVIVVQNNPSPLAGALEEDFNAAANNLLKGNGAWTEEGADQIKAKISTATSEELDDIAICISRKANEGGTSQAIIDDLNTAIANRRNGLGSNNSGIVIVGSNQGGHVDPVVQPAPQVDPALVQRTDNALALNNHNVVQSDDVDALIARLNGTTDKSELESLAQKISQKLDKHGTYFDGADKTRLQVALDAQCKKHGVTIKPAAQPAPQPISQPRAQQVDEFAGLHHEPIGGTEYVVKEGKLYKKVGGNYEVVPKQGEGYNINGKQYEIKGDRIAPKTEPQPVAQPVADDSAQILFRENEITAGINNADNPSRFEALQREIDNLPAGSTKKSYLQKQLNNKKYAYEIEHAESLQQLEAHKGNMDAAKTQMHESDYNRLCRSYENKKVDIVNKEYEALGLHNDSEINRAIEAYRSRPENKGLDVSDDVALSNLAAENGATAETQNMAKLKDFRSRMDNFEDLEAFKRDIDASGLPADVKATLKAKAKLEYQQHPDSHGTSASSNASASSAATDAGVNVTDPSSSIPGWLRAYNRTRQWSHRVTTNLRQYKPIDAAFNELDYMKGGLRGKQKSNVMFKGTILGLGYAGYNYFSNSQMSPEEIQEMQKQQQIYNEKVAKINSGEINRDNIFDEKENLENDPEVAPETKQAIIDYYLQLQKQQNLDPRL